MVRPVTVHEVAVMTVVLPHRIHVAPLSLEYFTKDSVIGDPPLLAGAAHVTPRLALPLVATTDVGLPGNPGLAGAELSDGGLLPTLFLAITLIT